MILAQLSFPIDYASFHAYLTANVPNADGLCSCDEGYNVIEKNPFTEDDQAAINAYYSALTQAGEAVKLTPSLQQRIQNSIALAMDFGNDLILQFGAENVLLGISAQPAQSIALSNYLSSLLNLLSSGSLYGAIDQINIYIADTSDDKANLSPYVTNTILYKYLNIIQAWLNISQTPNPEA